MTFLNAALLASRGSSPSRRMQAMKGENSQRSTFNAQRSTEGTCLPHESKEVLLTRISEFHVRSALSVERLALSVERLGSTGSRRRAALLASRGSSPSRRMQAMKGENSQLSTFNAQRLTEGTLLANPRYEFIELLPPRISEFHVRSALSVERLALSVERLGSTGSEEAGRMTFFNAAARERGSSPSRRVQAMKGENSQRSTFNAQRATEGTLPGKAAMNPPTFYRRGFRSSTSAPH